MQKVVDFLEKYCQWLAVGLAALFFLFALWQFLPGVSTPVTTPVGGTEYGPGEVDAVILEELAVPLNQKLTATSKIPDAVPPYANKFVGDLAKVPPTKPLPPIALSNRPVEIPPELVPDESKIGKMEVAGNTQVMALPTLPGPTLEPPTTGFAQVADPNAAPGAAPVQPVAAAPAGQPGAAPPVNAMDVTWVRVPYIISTRQVLIAFQQANIPEALMQTGVVRVELIRQRSLPGDQWEPEEVVKRFSVAVPLRDPPPAGAPPAIMLDYKNWAFANQAPIVQPPFFQIVGGEDPNVTKPEEIIAIEVFDPAAFPRNGDLSKLTPEQRKAVLEARRAAARAQQQQQRGGGGYPDETGGMGGPGGGPRGPRGRGGRGGGIESGGMERVAPSQRSSSDPIRLQYPRPGMPRPGQYPGQPYDPGMGTEQGGMEGMEGEFPMTPAAGQPITLPPVPPAPWDPRLAGSGLPDIFGVAYDIDARGDSTYRYRVRYYLANPIYNSQNVAADPKLAQQFELVGEDPTKWTDPIEIAPRSHVFLASPPQPSATSVRFVIYRWQDGRQHRAIQAVTTGDSIGRPEGNIDYRTPWTFVEVRRDPSTGNVYALMMNSEGRERRHVFTVDQASPLQKRLAGQVDAANAAAAAAAGTPGAAGRAPFE